VKLYTAISYNKFQVILTYAMFLDLIIGLYLRRWSLWDKRECLWFICKLANCPAPIINADLHKSAFPKIRPAKGSQECLVF